MCHDSTGGPASTTGHSNTQTTVHHTHPTQKNEEKLAEFPNYNHYNLDMRFFFSRSVYINQMIVVILTLCKTQNIIHYMYRRKDTKPKE